MLIMGKGDHVEIFIALIQILKRYKEELIKVF